MKYELALRLLQSALPNLASEGAAAELNRELRFLAEYKYNHYEMYHPGRLFLENLYLWLSQFDESERETALEFVRKNLIFVSRNEFQQLAQIMFNDRIRPLQFSIAAAELGVPEYRIKTIRDSKAFSRTTASTLYVGMSDGARLDFLRRHRLEINNEQVIPYYAVDDKKAQGCLDALRKSVDDPEAKFKCLLLIDDFAGSGNTLLRESISVALPEAFVAPEIPTRWLARLRFSKSPSEVELFYSGGLGSDEVSDLRALSPDPPYLAAIELLAERSRRRETKPKGSLIKVAGGAIGPMLEPDAVVRYCPLLTTEHAVSRLEPLFARLQPPFTSTATLPAATISSDVSVTDGASAIGALCEKYYSSAMADEHTGDVTFGYDRCGLPLVLHHNTPNNSFFLLWNRREPSFRPLFMRYERHGREGA